MTEGETASPKPGTAQSKMQSGAKAMFGTKTLKIVGALGAIILLSACASTSNTVDDVFEAVDTTSRAAPVPTGPTPGSQADLEQNAGHRVFFGYNQYTLTPQAQAVLARQAAWMKSYPETRIQLAGNCDERGTREYNLALGARRAQAARAYLVSLGVDGSRITTVSYGKERPIDPRSNESAWSLNRNSTTTISGIGA